MKRRCVLYGLLLAWLALAGFGCGQAPKQKVFVLGIDGLTFDLLVPWAQEGKLPNFARLLEQGNSTQLVSAIPPSSPPAWTSAITGVNPGKHGIFGFVKGFKPTEEGFDLIYYTAQDRKADPLWKMLTERGRRSVVINVPSSSPPDKLKGVMISGFPHTSLTNFTYPPEYRFKIPNYRKDIYGQAVRIDGEDDFLADINDIMDRRAEMILEVMQEEPWDLFFTVFTITDRVQHYFWKYMDPEHPYWDPQKAALYGDVILNTYQRLDDFLGKLRPLLDEQTTLLVMSDHGFGPVYQPMNGQNFIDRLNLPDEIGVLAADNFGAKFHLTTSKEPPYDSKTREAYVQAKELLKKELRQLKDPNTGQNVIREIFDRENLYSGPYMMEAPDIMALENKGYLFSNWSPTADKKIFPKKGDPALRQFFSGFHMMNGVLVLAGNNVRTRINNFDAQINDITPTILYLLGEPIPQGLDGRILTAPISEEYVQNHPLDASWARTSKPQEAWELADSAEVINTFIEEQLKAIGYVQ